MKKLDIIIGIFVLFILFSITAEGLFGAWRYVVVDPTNNRRGHMGITTVDTSDIIPGYGITVIKYFTGDVLDSVIFEVDTTKITTLGAFQEEYYPLINHTILDHGLIIEPVPASASIRVLGSDGGDFTVMLHDSLTAVSADSNFAVYDDDMSHVWVDEDGVIQKSTTGFPENPDGSSDSTAINLACVYAASGAIVWINTHYIMRKDRMFSIEEYMDNIHHYSIHSGFEIGEGTSSNLGFDFGDAGTKNVAHASHGWISTYPDSVDLDFIDDVYGAGSGTTFDNTVYGNGVSMSANYYSKFRLWMVINNVGLNEFHITRSTSEWIDVAHAQAAAWPNLPSDFRYAQIDLLGVVYKKSQTWDGLDLVKDWIITDFTAKGILSGGGVAGLGTEDVQNIAAGVVGDSLDEYKTAIDSININVSDNVSAIAALPTFAETGGVVSDSIDAFIVGGTSTFNSMTGRQITHNLGVADHFTFITQTDSSGYVGEIHVRAGTTVDTVFNSGSETTSGFMWIVLPNR